MFTDILTAQDYCTTDQYVRDAIDENIRNELNNLGNDLDAGKTSKKGKSSHEQMMSNLKNSTSDKFKYLWANDNAFDFDYEEEERKKRDKEMELVMPEKYQVLGYNYDQGANIKRRPVLRMSDVYTTNNSKVRRLINRVFQRHIYGKAESQKTHDNGVLISKSTSNYQQLQHILKNFQNQNEDYNIENQQANMDEDQLEQYIIDRGQSKSNYFLYYRNEKAKKIDMSTIVNNPLSSKHFLKNLHREVKQKQRQYHRIQEPQSEVESEDGSRGKEKKEGEEKKKEYFGQFKKNGKKQKMQTNIKIQDTLDPKARSGEQIAQNIINQYAYIDNSLLNNDFYNLNSENVRLELNLSNPNFFQPKLHTILTRQTELMQENEIKQRIAEANKKGPENSLISGGRNKFSQLSPSQAPGFHNNQSEEEKMTVEDFINLQIRSISKEPIKHSEIATKFQFVKFTLEEDVFHHYHRCIFNFPQHISQKVKVQVHVEKMRKSRSNGLVINAEMKESNDKFCRKQDISCAKGQFIIVEYIEETPILMSDVGMCERMFIQVNYPEILQKMRQEIFKTSSLEDMEQNRDKLMTTHLSYRKHSPLWRQIIRQEFGQNGKQFYWEPKLNLGKVIGIPEGPGTIVMESNLGVVPVVKKKPSGRDFLLVRQGKRWVIRRIDHIYTAGQVQPSKRVHCPGSRQHTDFKLGYERAFIVKQIKEYGQVNMDQLKLIFKGETQNSLRKALKSCNANSRDGKNYKIHHEIPPKSEHLITPEDICLYERMQKSLCQLKQVGILEIRSNEKMKNVLKEFNKKHYTVPEKIAIARVIREQLQLTSWYLTDSFLKYKQKASKIQINGFADPTNGRGGYSFINKPQKQRTAREDMEQKQKPKTLAPSDLRKLNCEESRQKLREMGYNQDEIDRKGRWSLINLLKNQEGTQFSRRQRQTKFKKLQNQRKEISKNFNRLLAWLKDELQEPAFNYNHIPKNKLSHYLKRQHDYIEKIKRRYTNKDYKPQNPGAESDQSDD